MSKRPRWKPPEIPAAEDLKKLLRARYDERKGWITMFEVRSHTGYAKGAGRFADALALNVWPSAGLALHGFEIKVSRNDLQRELREEGKDAIKRFCDWWWLVVPDLDTIEGFELPSDWGVMVSHGRRLVVHREVAQRERAPWPRDFCASLVRNAAEGSAALIAARQERDEIRKTAREEALAQAQVEIDEAKRDAKDAEEKLDAFAGATGRTSGRYMGVEQLRAMGELVRASSDQQDAIMADEVGL